MTIVFLGNEREAFAANTGPVTEATTAGTFNATYCRSSLFCSGSTQAIDSEVLGALATAYTRFDFYTAYVANSGRVYVRWYNSSGTEVFRLTGNTSSQFQMQYWSGATWTNIGGTATAPNSVLSTIQVKIVCGASGAAELLVNDVSVASGTAAMAAVTNIDKVQYVDNIGGGSALYYSRITVANVDLTGYQQFLSPATSNGTDTGGTGTYTDINELPLNDATMISLAAAGDRHDFKSAARSFGSTTVKGVTITARAQKGLSGPTKMKFYLLISGTRYYSPDVSLTTSLTGYEYTWELNPATSAAWTNVAAADANLEWGWEAVT